MALFSMMKDIRIAAVIMNSPVAKIRQNLDKMAEWTRAAKKQGASIICFPEMNVTGYGVHPEITQSAESVPGSISQVLLQLAGEEDMLILAGMAEKEREGRIFASHLVIGSAEIIGVYRKLHIAPPERDIFTPGDHVPLFEKRGVKLGIQLCYDAHFPELSTHMALKGADLIFMPHASPRGTPQEKFSSWMRHLPARAYDNGLFIVACNQTGENAKGLSFPGIAVIIGPTGEVIAKNLSGKEEMIVAELKADDLARVRKHKMRFFLPNRRPDLYSA
jgi:predicted amidohydrolase